MFYFFNSSRFALRIDSFNAVQSLAKMIWVILENVSAEWLGSVRYHVFYEESSQIY